MRPSFSQVLRRAFFASVIADVLGSVLLAIGILFGSLIPGGSGGPTAESLLGFFLFLAIAVVSFGTVAATVLSRLALRLAPTRTVRAAIGLVAFGALAGFIILFVIGFVMTLRDNPDNNPFVLGPSEVLVPSLILGSLFGGLTAAAWWWLSPKPGESSSDRWL